jgi:hypothetical protein
VGVRSAVVLVVLMLKDKLALQFLIHL